MANSRFEVFKGEGKESPGYYWRLIAGNGEIVASSEAYDTEYNALRGAQDASRAALGAVNPMIALAEEAEDAS